MQTTDELEQFMDSVFVAWREFTLPSYEYVMEMPYTRLVEMQKHLGREQKLIEEKMKRRR